MLELGLKNGTQDIISVILSNPNGEQQYHKIRIFQNGSEKESYFCESFTKTQSFHNIIPQNDLTSFLQKHCGSMYKNTVINTVAETITILSNKKGKISILKKPHKEGPPQVKSSQNKQKKYILEEGFPVPFLVHLGVMTEQGKVVSSKYDKFRQINRFLEFINDIIPREESNKAFTVLDFGCGKSYLTFALYYFLVEICKKKVHITGID